MRGAGNQGNDSVSRRNLKGVILSLLNSELGTDRLKIEKFFRFSDYRCLIYPRLPHRGKNVLIIPALIKNGWTIDEIRKTFNMKV
jgi:hypothetical protein